MATTNPTILFAGLGAMGHGMATHLVRSGFPVIGYDVHAPSVARFVSESGGRGASSSSSSSPRAAAQEANVDVLLVMVANETQVSELLFHPERGAVGGLKRGATVLLCSTVSPGFVALVKGEIEMEMVRMEGRGKDLGLVDCPVSGGVGRAREGLLSLFASSDDEEGVLFKPDVQSILSCLSDTEKKKLYHVPGGLGAGSKAKLIHQIFAGVHIALASEVMGLAAMAGLDTRAVYDEVRKRGDGEGDSWIFGDRVRYMLQLPPPPGLGAGGARYSALSIITKDMGIVSETARGIVGGGGFPLPMAGVAEQVFLSAVAKGWGGEDDCVVVRLYLDPQQPHLVAQRAGRPSDSSDPAGKVGIAANVIEDLLVGVHLAVASEAMAFCEALGVGTELLYDVVCNAAGASRVFETCFRDLKGCGWGVKGVKGVEGIRDRLMDAVAKAGKLKYPLFLSSAALQELNRQLR